MTRWPFTVMFAGSKTKSHASASTHDWVLNGHPLLLQLAASPCDCRSKTQLLTSAAFSAAQLYHVDRAGLGAQCIAPSTDNLGLTIHTGWACQLHAEQMEYAPLRLTMPSLLFKQLLKFRTRLLAGNKGNLSIHAKIVYFNASRSACFIMCKRIDISPNHFCAHYTRLCRNSCSSGIGSRN